MFGVASSQLFYGPVSEGVGRKPVMLFGIVLALLVVVFVFSQKTLLCFCWTIYSWYRPGAGSLFRSVMRDIYHGRLPFMAPISLLNTFITLALLLVDTCKPPTIGKLAFLSFHFHFLFFFACMGTKKATNINTLIA